MRTLIAAINMTLDGFCNHTEMIADDEIHQHYNELLSNADALIYGRITYQLSVQPTVLGSGLPLFKNVKDRINLTLLKTKTFGCGAITLYYEPAKK